MKRVIRIPEGEFRSVDDVYYDWDYIPFGSIRTDSNGRKREIKVSLVSQNGRHVICRDVGRRYGEDYWEYLPVDKVVISDFEYRIHLRKPARAAA